MQRLRVAVKLLETWPWWAVSGHLRNLGADIILQQPQTSEHRMKLTFQ